jgi:ribosomal protein S18 acetylase RimI-like enzyme
VEIEMSEIRAMRIEDLAEVNAVFTKAFSHARIEEGLKQHRISPCRIAFLRMYLDRGGEGALVAVDRGQVVGFNFNHLFGSTGWMGPLAVLPKYQGVGVGKALVRAGAGYLEKRGAKIIGLETMPRNFRNIGFYSRLGFVSGPLCLDMVAHAHSGPAGPAAQGTEIASIGGSVAADRESLIGGCSEIATALCPGLDYTGEIRLNMKHRFGDTVLLLEDGVVTGFAVCHIEPYGQYEERRELKISILAMRPEPGEPGPCSVWQRRGGAGGPPEEDQGRRRPAENNQTAAGDGPLSQTSGEAQSETALARLCALLNGIRALAAREGLSVVRLHVRSDKWAALRALLSWGYNVGYSDLRMCLSGFIEDEPGNFIHFCRWQ